MYTVDLVGGLELYQAEARAFLGFPGVIALVAWGADPGKLVARPGTQCR